MPIALVTIQSPKITFLRSKLYIYYSYSHKDNLNLRDESCEIAIMESLKAFESAGGGCVVENSTFGLHRKTSFLKRLSEQTGVHIIAGTGITILGKH